MIKYPTGFDGLDVAVDDAVELSVAGRVSRIGGEPGPGMETIMSRSGSGP